jgi:hypothetical protein
MPPPRTIFPRTGGSCPPGLPGTDRTLWKKRLATPQPASIVFPSPGGRVVTGAGQGIGRVFVAGRCINPDGGVTGS